VNRAVATAEIIESKVFTAEKVVFTDRADSAALVRRRRPVLTAADLAIKRERSAKWRAKWNWAIRRVMLQNYVTAVRGRLREVELIQMLRENLRARKLGREGSFTKTHARAEQKNKALLADDEVQVQVQEPPANALASRSNSDKSGMTEVGDYSYDAQQQMELELEQSEDTVGWINSPLTTKIEQGSMSIQV
jgi:hypothetical protein